MPEEHDEPDEPEAASSRGSTRRSKPSGPRRRVIDRAWFWIPLVVLVVGGALVASFVVERRHNDEAAAPPLAPEQFCNTASEIQAFPALTVELGTGGSTQLQQFQAELDKLASLAPTPTATDIKAIRDSFDPVIEDFGSNGGSPQALNDALALLDQQSASVTDQANRVSAYTEKWCGFDLMTPSETTPPAPGAGDTAVPTATPGG